MAGFMRESKDGKSWTYESSDRYSLRFERNCAVDGWTAVTMDDFSIALFKDAAMATAFKDMMNLAAHAAKRPTAASGDENRAERGQGAEGDQGGGRG